jgi:hypothetical protein
LSFRSTYSSLKFPVCLGVSLAQMHSVNCICSSVQDTNQKLASLSFPMDVLRTLISKFWKPRFNYWGGEVWRELAWYHKLLQIFHLQKKTMWKQFQ